MSSNIPANFYNFSNDIDIDKDIDNNLNDIDMNVSCLFYESTKITINLGFEQYHKS